MLSGLVPPSVAFMHYLFESGAFTDLEFIHLASIRNSPALPPQSGVTDTFLHDCWRSNLRLSLPIEPSLQPCFSCLHIPRKRHLCPL